MADSPDINQAQAAWLAGRTLAALKGLATEAEWRDHLKSLGITEAIASSLMSFAASTTEDHTR
jgi:hypothetical protein